MAEQLFILRGVPDDEADEIRTLLQENAIDFYETPAGNWGISMPAIWLRDTTQLLNAKRLIAEYQMQRQIRIRREYAALKQAGAQRTLWRSLLDNPVRFIVYLAISLALLYFSVRPFFNFAN